MKYNKSNSFLRIVFVLLLIALVMIASITIAIDPLFQYHLPWFGLQPVITNERYQNAGIAKSYRFDNVIIGNSYSENFQPSWFSEYWDGPTVKLVAAGSHIADMSYLFEILNDREKQPARILINFYPDILLASATELKHELPTYLYDDNYLNDVSYLFNFTIMKDFTYQMIKSNRDNDIPDIDTLFVWDTGDVCGREKVLEAYERPEINVNPADGAELLTDDVIANTQIMLKYIQEMPDTEFILFCSPFSIAYWDSACRTGQLDHLQNAYQYALDLLLPNDNVSFYLFNDSAMRDTITDLDNYRDSTHYSAGVSQDIALRICQEQDLITVDNCHDELNDFFAFFKEYPYDTIFD